MSSSLALGAARHVVPRVRPALRQRAVSRVAPVVAQLTPVRSNASRMTLARARRPLRLVLAAAEAPEGVQAPASSAAQEDAEEAEELYNEAKRILNLLYDKRSMKLAEVKLIMGIEDPRAAARREAYGIEDESGASRDDVVQALMEVSANQVPADRVAFRQLVAELRAWPYLEQEDSLRGTGPSPYAEITETGLSRSERKAQAQARMPQDEMIELEPEKDLSDYLPKWFGYSAVYIVSAIPVFITIAALSLLFISSLK